MTVLWALALALGLVTAPGVDAGAAVCDGSDLPDGCPVATIGGDTPAPDGPAGPGLGGYGMQAEFRRLDDPGLIDLVSGAGFTWVKQQVTWSDVELAPDEYRWEELDRLVDSIHSRGISILMSVIKTPDFYKPPELVGRPSPPTDVTKFHRFMFLLAQRYPGKVQAFEIWNEPNLPLEWGRVHERAHLEYFHLLQMGYRAVKEANPDAIVVLGAAAATGVMDPDLGIDDRIYLQRLVSINHGEVGQYFDALGVHVHGGPNAPDDTRANPAHSWTTCSGGWTNHPSFFFDRYKELYQVLLDAGITGKTVWVTELGWASTADPAAGFEYARCISEQDQAAFLVRAFERLREESPYVTHAFIWNLNFQQVFGPDDQRWAFGIVRHDLSPRPAYLAVQNMRKLPPGGA